MRRGGVLVGGVAAALLGGLIVWRLSAAGTGSGRRVDRGPAPVEVGPVEHGPLEERRTFAGTLEARARFVVAAHVGGRVERLHVDLADPVRQGQVVAELDDQEHLQTNAEAAAELGVARANLADAESSVEIAERELRRVEGLEAKGIVSDSELDNARSRYLAATSAVEVSKAQVTRATAALRRARIRSGYAKVIATWSGDDEERVVAQRFVEEGDNVAPNDPIVSVVDLSPIKAVVFVTEKEYGRLEPGQTAMVTTDAFPGRGFDGVVARIAPVFRQSSRQARMEITIPNAERLLKPGMFVRVEVVLSRVEQATIVPVAALTTREGKQGVFVVDAAGERVAWHPVEVGIRQDDRVEVRGDGIEGRVVTLGQQLVTDGAPISIPEPAGAAAEAGGSPEGS